jgi:DNA-binding FrmR family transcriptional regulator
MKLRDEEQVAEILQRLRRTEGQIGGIIRMIESGRDCDEVVTQLAAVSRALDRAGFKLVACAMRQSIAEEAAGARPAMDVEQMEKLFLTLA